MRRPFKRPVKIPVLNGGGLYQYELGPRFDPGAQGEVFEPLFELPLLRYIGAATRAGFLRVTQQPQLWFNQQTGIVGLGGLQAGQLISQPLIDPTQDNT